MTGRRPFRITCVGCDPAHIEAIRRTVDDAGCAATVDVVEVPRIRKEAFPKPVVHAVILSSASLQHCDAEGKDVLRTAAGWGTFRLYVPGHPPSAESPMDDFIQRTGTGDIAQTTREILAFFEQADAINRVSTRRALRDQACTALYPLLGLLWPLSYVCLGALVVGFVLRWIGHQIVFDALRHPAVLPVICGGFGFFLAHLLYTTLKNTALAVFVVRRVPPPAFFMPLFALGALAGCAVWFCWLLGCAWQLPLWLVPAAALYALYLRCRRIRAELLSLSAIQRQLESSGARADALLDIGSARISSGAIPLFPHRSRQIFISYMHRSEWSVRTACRLHEQLTAAGYPVFFDRSTIEPGTLWRAHLMRGLSECGLFIAVLDDEAAITPWVLSESVHAATLRKNVGKPRILLAIRGPSGPARLAQGPFGRIYRDLFALPEPHRPGTRIVVVPPEGIPQEHLVAAIEGIRPLCVVP